MIPKCHKDANLKTLFERLWPEQRLVYILFDEAKLTQVKCFTGGNFLGHVHNVSHALELQERASHALTLEVVCNHVGSGVIPVAKLNAGDLEL